MIRTREEKADTKPVIDLSGGQGNAYTLLGYVRRFGRQLEMSVDEMNKISEEMQSDDYDHLVEVFDKHFGEYVEIYR